MNILLKSINDSSDGKLAGGLLSEDDIRNAAKALGDLSSSMKNNPTIDLVPINFLNFTNQDVTMQPLKLDFNEFGGFQQADYGADHMNDVMLMEPNFEDLAFQGQEAL